MTTKPKQQKQVADLIELNEELENYFRNTIIPQLFVDANLILRKFTPPAMKQFDFSPECIGKPMEELVDNIRYSTIMENIEDAIASGEVFEKEIQTTDRRWFQMNIVPYIVQKTGKPNGVILTFVDITDRIRDTRALEQLNSAHENFIYSVSHDLKAPLANIEALIHNLTDWDTKQEQKDLTRMLEGAIKRMRVIINELTEITKIESNYQDSAEEVNLEELLREVELTVKEDLYSSKGEITHDLQVKHLRFERKNIRSILYNLLSNAVKYRSEKRAPHIKVSTRREKEGVVLTVKDNGRGIAADQRDFVFSKFTRVEKNVPGSGIGLYLVRKIADNTGGRVELKSRLGSGSEFTVHLKQLEEAKKSEPKKSEPKKSKK